jgi:hypothetical protein
LGKVVSIGEVRGDNLEARFSSAQEELGKDGGVVYFPPGTYKFGDNLRIRSGLVVRGCDPVGVRDARDAGYDLLTRFEFPRFVPKCEGEGSPIESAFKGIRLDSPSNGINCGIANVAINHGHISFDEDNDHNAGSNRIVYGCVVRNAAIAEPTIPSAFQERRQRFTQRHHAAIHVTSGWNLHVERLQTPREPEEHQHHCQGRYF